MLYRENGQFKASYRADQQIFPIRQDRIALVALLLIAFVLVPLSAPEYLFRAILIPFLILSLAALGLNILVGYCGQISLGTGAFMAVGAYAAYNFQVRIEGMPLIASLLLGGACSTVVGVLFGIPSLRIKGLYLAVATLAAQFFVDWAALRLKFVTNGSDSGSVSVAGAFSQAVRSAHGSCSISAAAKASTWVWTGAARSVAAADAPSNSVCQTCRAADGRSTGMQWPPASMAADSGASSR